MDEAEDPPVPPTDGGAQLSTVRMRTSSAADTRDDNAPTTSRRARQSRNGVEMATSLNGASSLNADSAETTATGRLMRKAKPTSFIHMVNEEESEDSEDSKNSDEDEAYEMEHILEIKRVKGKEQYLVKWKDYGDEDNSWQTIENLQDGEQCDHLKVIRAILAGNIKKPKWYTDYLKKKEGGAGPFSAHTRRSQRPRPLPQRITAPEAINHDEPSPKSTGRRGRLGPGPKGSRGSRGGPSGRGRGRGARGGSRGVQREQFGDESSDNEDAMDHDGEMNGPSSSSWGQGSRGSRGGPSGRGRGRGALGVARGEQRDQCGPRDTEEENLNTEDRASSSYHVTSYSRSSHGQVGTSKAADQPSTSNGWLENGETQESNRRRFFASSDANDNVGVEDNDEDVDVDVEGVDDDDNDVGDEIDQSIAAVVRGVGSLSPQRRAGCRKGQPIGSAAVKPSDLPGPSKATTARHSNGSSNRAPATHHERSTNNASTSRQGGNPFEIPLIRAQDQYHLTNSYEDFVEYDRMREKYEEFARRNEGRPRYEKASGREDAMDHDGEVDGPSSSSRGQAAASRKRDQPSTSNGRREERSRKKRAISMVDEDQVELEDDVDGEDGARVDESEEENGEGFVDEEEISDDDWRASLGYMEGGDNAVLNFNRSCNFGHNFESLLISRLPESMPGCLMQLWMNMLQQVIGASVSERNTALIMMDTLGAVNEKRRRFVPVWFKISSESTGRAHFLPPLRIPEARERLKRLLHALGICPNAIWISTEKIQKACDRCNRVARADDGDQLNDDDDGNDDNGHPPPSKKRRPRDDSTKRSNGQKLQPTHHHHQQPHRERQQHRQHANGEAEDVLVEASVVPRESPRQPRDTVVMHQRPMNVDESWEEDVDVEVVEEVVEDGVYPIEEGLEEQRQPLEYEESSNSDDRDDESADRERTRTHLTENFLIDLVIRGFKLKNEDEEVEACILCGTLMNDDEGICSPEDPVAARRFYNNLIALETDEQIKFVDQLRDEERVIVVCPRHIKELSQKQRLKKRKHFYTEFIHHDFSTDQSNSLSTISSGAKKAKIEKGKVPQARACSLHDLSDPLPVAKVATLLSNPQVVQRKKAKTAKSVHSDVHQANVTLSTLIGPVVKADIPMQPRASLPPNSQGQNGANEDVNAPGPSVPHSTPSSVAIPMQPCASLSSKPQNGTVTGVIDYAQRSSSSSPLSSNSSTGVSAAPAATQREPDVRRHKERKLQEIISRLPRVSSGLKILAE